MIRLASSGSCELGVGRDPQHCIAMSVTILLTSRDYFLIWIETGDIEANEICSAFATLQYALARLSRDDRAGAE